MARPPAEQTPVALSARERQVATLVAEGLTNREIAGRLFISERTVDGHLEHIREKLGVSTRAQVTAWVIRSEATPVPERRPPARPVGVAPRRLLVHPRAWLAGALVLACLAAGVGVLRLIQPPAPVIQTFVGCTTPGGCFFAETQPALGAELFRPTSIAIDTKGNTYIADFGNGRIRRVAKGVMSTIVGGGNGPLADGALGLSVSTPSLGFASTVAVDGHDQAYVLTSRNRVLEVWSIDSSGFVHFVVSLGSSSSTLGGLAAPNLPLGGLAISHEGVLFIGDRAGNRIMRYQPGSVATLYAGGGVSGLGDGGDAKSAQLNWPTALTLDRQENLLIADTGNHRIRRVDHVKETITTVAGGTSESEGNTGDGGPATQARLSFPMGVVVASNGVIVIADTGNNRLREIYQGKIEALAGSGQWEDLGDGLPAAQAGFNAPEDVALDANGNLYTADTGNNRVREIPHLFGTGS